MWKLIVLWVVLLIFPAAVLYTMTDLRGLVVYLSYYAPLWFSGEPFFKPSTDIGWHYPTIYGHILAVFVYSIVFWGAIFLISRSKRFVSATNHRRHSD